MIITKITSGFGNQMFQYAAGYALAARHRTTLLLDADFYQHNHTRTFELGRLRISARMINAVDRLRVLVSDPAYLGRRQAWLRRLGLPRKLHLLSEGPTSASDAPLAAPDNTVLSGYWQGEALFAGVRDDLLGEFAFRDPPDAANSAVLALIGRTPSPVCVHVRRGDYLTGNEVVSPVPLTYYHDAIAWIRQRVPDPHFVVFSDDPPWTRANLPVPPTSTFVTHNTGKRDPEDLRLMSACRHFIIANSTFSWWGAWLSAPPSPDRLVVAPRRWYAVEHAGENRIVPSSWTRL